MIAPLKQRLRFEESGRPELLPRMTAGTENVAGGRSAGLALASGALGFFCLVPYPAIAVGGTSAVQIGNVLALLLALPVVTISWSRRAFWVYPVIVLPLLVSTARMGMGGGGEAGVGLKSAAVWAVSCAMILIPQLYGGRYAVQMLTGIALATLLHAGLGLWQVYSFSSGVFPFPELYVNQSFLSVQENAQTIARYTQRPFGLFPEPSAMSSSLAPWVLFFAAELCGLVRLRQAVARWQAALFGTAAAGGLGLIILSQSGHAAVTLAGLLVIALVWLLRCGATMRTYLAIVGVLGVILPVVLWFAALSLGNRVGDAELGNSSWEERSASLRLGFEMMVGGGWARGIFGVGVGQIAPALWDAAQIDAVFSVLLTYVYETGLVGLLAIGAVGVYLARVWKRAGFSAAYAVIGVVWLVGITLTTSYEQLLSPWMVLGWLTVWPEICEVRRRPAAVRSVEEVIGEPGVSVVAAGVAKRWTER